MTIPPDLRYSADHEWVQAHSAGSVKVGVTHHAARELGDVVYVDLPQVGAAVEAGTACGEIESTKSVAEIFCPVSGTVSGVNAALEDQPELVNSDPYGAGWLFEVAPTAWSGDLLDAAGYATLIGEEGQAG